MDVLSIVFHLVVPDKMSRVDKPWEAATPLRDAERLVPVTAHSLTQLSISRRRWSLHAAEFGPLVHTSRLLQQRVICFFAGQEI